MAGIPGSGKSTLAERLALERGAVLISTDRLRAEITGRAEDRSRDRAVFARALAAVEENLRAGRDVVYDATNLTPSVRRRVLASVPHHARKICYYLRIPLEMALRRNAARERVVPPSVIAAMHGRFKEPRAEEGWQEIVEIGPEWPANC